MKQWNNVAMILRSLVLQNFRSYTQQKFDFSEDTTVIIGPNTAGKTNLAEAISLLTTGKSFRSATDIHLIHFGKEIGRVKGLVTGQSGSENDKTTLEIILMSPQYNNGRFGKKFLVNEVSKTRNTFLGILPLVLFRPEELDIIIDGPSLRRAFLDEVLEQVDREYVTSLASYERALRQRNALLERARETGQRNEEQFHYWDALVIEHGQYITQKREAFIVWMNTQIKEVIEFAVTYDASTISQERLVQYADAEVGAGVTLVGPHRDDFFIELTQDTKEPRNVKIFGSRGQQRLVVLQLKLLQIQYMTEKFQAKPLFVLDDIFSELDTKHIELVLERLSRQQIIITTTHREFIPEGKIKSFTVIELSK